jgi:hypothetical protein
METLHVSPQGLAKASAGAAAAAAIVLALFVLPAETGIDVTGIGSAIGLTRMGEAAAAAPSRAVPAAPAATAAMIVPDRASIEKKAALRSDEMEIELPPHQGAEVKAHMQAGDHFVFRWESSGGPVKVDMHGEPPNAGDDEFTSYWEERQLSSAQGSFTAPFAGNHGWYWRNKGETPITVKLRTTGFYKDLFRPHAE